MARQPIFNVPGGVTLAIAIIVLVQAGIWFLAERDQDFVRACLAFNPLRYVPTRAVEPITWGGLIPCDGRLSAILTFFSHIFVHGDWTHLAVNSAWLLAFGGALAKRIGNLRFAALGIASGLAGALMFLAFRYGEPVPMVGASGAVSGLMGAAFRFFFNDEHYGGIGNVREDPTTVPRLTLRETFANRQVQFMVGIWAVLNFATAAFAHLLTDGAGIAWEAHLGGFLFGLLAFALFDPPQVDAAAVEYH